MRFHLETNYNLTTQILWKFFLETTKQNLETWLTYSIKLALKVYNNNNKNNNLYYILCSYWQYVDGDSCLVVLIV